MPVRGRTSPTFDLKPANIELAYSAPLQLKLGQHTLWNIAKIRRYSLQFRDRP
jgi:hypothetical protein